MGPISAIKSKTKAWLHRSHAPLRHILERQTAMQALTLARHNRALSSLHDLSEVEFSAFSQWGEDGIIDWLVSRVPDIPKTFIEFGVEDYQESNTRLLLQLRNWRGLVIDGSADHIGDIRSQDIYWRHGLTAKCAFIDRDNINRLLEDEGMVGPVGLLSVDIDGNDYWVWRSIEVVSPGIVVAEYNAVFGDIHPLTIPYRDDFQRTQAHHSNLYFGASLPALIQLGGQKGYTFVGTASTGCNAFFVRDDLAAKVTQALSNSWGYPSYVREARDENGNLLFLDGAARAKQIAYLPLVNPQTGAQTSLAECGELYSESWKAGQRTLI
jgi:hypothetical protein